MALPFPTNNFMTTVMRYDIHNLPVSLNITAIPEVQHLVPSMTMAVINGAGEISHINPARIFCYNMLSYNYFSNAELLEVVRLGIDLLALGLYKRTYMNPEAGLTHSASHALTLFTSTLIVKYKELETMVDNQVLQAAYQNHASFQSVKDEINALYASLQSNQGNMVQSNYYPNQPMGMNYNQPMNQMNQMNQMNSFPQNNMMNRAPVPIPNRPTLQSGQVSAFGGTQRSASVSARPDSQFNMTEGRFIKRRKQPQPIMNEDYNTAELVSEPIAQEVIPDSKLHKIAGSTMNREQHRTVFHDKFEMNHKRITKHNEQAVKLDEEAIRIAERGEDFVSDETMSSFVYPKWIYDNFLETAIGQGLVKKLVDGKTDIYRTFNLIGVPFISKYDLRPSMDIIRSSDSFISLANKMQAMITSLNLETDVEKANAVMTFIAQLDNMFTTMLNDFLEYNLNPGGHIESFVADITTLRGDLIGAYGPSYGKALDLKENEMMDILFNLEVDSSLSDAPESLLGLDVPKTLFTTTLNTSYSITYLSITDKELGINLQDNRFIIDRKTMPDLWAIVNSLRPNKISFGATTLTDLLITSDGVRYRLFTSYTNSDYKIVKL